MSEENQTENTINEPQTSAETSQPKVEPSNPDLEAIIASRMEDERNKMLSEFKDKLDSAYSARDEILREKAQLEEEKKAVEIKRMEEEGKHKEVAELRLAEMSAKNEALSKRVTELTRDHEVTNAIAGLEFRSDVAGEMARDRILAQTMQDETGVWKHKSGVSIKEFVEHFKKDEANAFLFKPKTNTGAGTQQQAGTVDMKSNKPITEMNTQELLAHFANAPRPTTGNF